MRSNFNVFDVLIEDIGNIYIIDNTNASSCAVHSFGHLYS